MRVIVSVIVNAVALWLTTLIVSAGVHVTPYGAGGTLELVLTYALLGAIWGVINAVIGSAIRFVAFPIYIITLGLVSLIVNGFLFWLTGVVSGWIKFGLTVDSFGWAILAALVMSILTAILGAVTRGARDSRRRDDD